MIRELSQQLGEMERFSLALRPSMGIKVKKGEDKRRALRPASVDPIEPLAGSRGGEEISIIIQGSRRSGRRRTPEPIPDLEVARNFLDDQCVFDETDDE
jgi:hypothetical protein